MSLTIVISTYNQPTWLEKVLFGYIHQTFRGFEILIADDGSTVETKNVIDRFAGNDSFEIRHIYQRDEGFRKCEILNKSIVASSYDYIIITDGDCIPRNDFVEVHMSRRQKGYFLSGGYCKLPKATSQIISEAEIENQRCFDSRWLRRNGFPFSKTHLKLCRNPFYSKFMNDITPATCNLKGSNASFWKEDAEKVNGFNEDMAWGGEDREFGVRLKNIGIKPRHVRYDAICLHLFHTRPYRDEKIVRKNREIRRQAEIQRIQYARNGILKSDQ